MKKKKINILLLSLLLSSCSTSQLDRLEWLGKKPPMSEQKVQNPTFQWPAELPKYTKPASSNSLWDGNSKTFFKDQRAGKVGDIVTVRVAVQDRAQVNNRTERRRTENDNVRVPEVFGLQGKLAGLTKVVSGSKGNPANLFDQETVLNNRGEGIINRTENINTVIAAVITKVLPNGNFAIYGSQEVRINYELRQLTVKGVIRPEDITPNNEVSLQQIAEARISYGGAGVIDDIQQPRIGNQVADILSPF
ncbi:MAG: flagellar basal body L-ring protein FlgH [Rickettsiales bacterium]|nr:flagellar basal body L-ring protein FlgH [Rickettsiales bacterium]